MDMDDPDEAAGFAAFRAWFANVVDLRQLKLPPMPLSDAKLLELAWEVLARAAPGKIEYYLVANRKAWQAQHFTAAARLYESLAEPYSTPTSWLIWQVWTHDERADVGNHLLQRPAKRARDADDKDDDDEPPPRRPRREFLQSLLLDLPAEMRAAVVGFLHTYRDLENYLSASPSLKQEEDLRLWRVLVERDILGALDRDARLLAHSALGQLVAVTKPMDAVMALTVPQQLKRLYATAMRQLSKEMAHYTAQRLQLYRGEVDTMVEKERDIGIHLVGDHQRVLLGFVWQKWHGSMGKQGHDLVPRVDPAVAARYPSMARAMADLTRLLENGFSVGDIDTPAPVFTHWLPLLLHLQALYYTVLMDITPHATLHLAMEAFDRRDPQTDKRGLVLGISTNGQPREVRNPEGSSSSEDESGSSVEEDDDDDDDE